MSEIQVCEGIWRNRSGQRLYITQCEPDDDGQQWTDGAEFYLDDGTYDAILGEGDQDLVEYIGPFPYNSQRAPVSRPAETESTTAVAGGVSDDPGRIIYELEERVKVQNATIIGQTAEIDRLKGEKTAEIARLQAEWQSEFNAAQQLRSEVQQLELLLDDARDNLRSLEADGTAMDHHCQGMKAAFLAVIKTLWEMRR